MDKVSRFARKTLRGVHRLFRGVHFYLGGCKRQRGCILNSRGAPTNWYLTLPIHYIFSKCKRDIEMPRIMLRVFDLTLFFSVGPFRRI